MEKYTVKLSPEEQGTAKHKNEKLFSIASIRSPCEVDYVETLSHPKANFQFSYFVAFIDGEVQNVCERIDDYQISIDRDLPQDLWDTFKKEGFMGMIIPKSYGGKGFSAHGHSQVVQKISSCSSNVSGTIAVPNSLGPGK